MKQCSVSDCVNPSTARDWCGKHYQRWRKRGDITPVARRRYPVIPCSVDGCDRRAKAHHLCDKHYQRWVKHGDPHRVNPSRPLRPLAGADNPRWKGDTAKYTAIHHRLYRLRGPAAAHRRERCDNPAEDWAYDRTDPNGLVDQKTGFPYSTDPARYLSLCKRCHWSFDRPAVTP